MVAQFSYQACEKRVEGVAGKHCTGQYFDYWGCVDKCVCRALPTSLWFIVPLRTQILGSPPFLRVCPFFSTGRLNALSSMCHRDQF